MKKLKKATAALISLSVAAMLITPVYAQNPVTAKSIRDMIFSSGLSSYPALLDEAAYNMVGEFNALEEMKTVGEIFDTGRSFRIFDAVKDKDGKYTVDRSQDYMYFIGSDQSGKASALYYYSDNYYDESVAGKVYYSTDGEFANGYTQISEFYENISPYISNEKIADIINSHDVGDVSEILLATGAVFVKSDKGEFAVSVEETNDIHAEYLGREVKNIHYGDFYTFDEFIKKKEYIHQNLMDDPRDFFDIYGGSVERPEKIQGDEIRDTDTRAAYEGKQCRFKDVPQELAVYVSELSELDIISGYEDNTFKPDSTVTRAEAAAMLTRLFMINSGSGTAFDDVKKTDWFYGNVYGLYEAGLINGVSEQSFAPDKTITYNELFKILVSGLGHGERFIWEGYPDRTNEQAIYMKLNNGIDTIDTAAPITRGDMAVILSNALDTHIFTWNHTVLSDAGNVANGYYDITLADYRNGKKLNGILIRSEKEYKEFFGE